MITYSLKRTVSIVNILVIFAVNLLLGFTDITPTAHAAGTTDGLIAWYKFDDVSGNVIKDASGKGNNSTAAGETYSFTDWEQGKAISLSGGTSASGANVKLPNGILNGVTNFTISTWVNMRATTSYMRIFDFGSGNTTSYMYLTPTGNNDGAKGLAFGITTSGWSNEEKAQKGTALTTNIWKHVTVVLNGHTVTLYENGLKVGENTSLTLNPSSLGATTANYIGKGQFADPTINALFSDFRIYNRALDASEVAGLINKPDSELVAADMAALLAGVNLRTVDTDLSLITKGPYGSDITWQSSNTNVIAKDGKVTRPAPGQSDAAVTLTATVTKGAAHDSKVFEAVVLAQLSDQQKLQLDKDAISLGNISAVTKNLDLPTEGRNGSVITWQSSNTSVIGHDGTVIRPTPRSGNAVVNLTATIKNGNASDTKTFIVTVLEEPFVLTLSSIEDVNVDTVIGTAPVLPSSVIAVYNDEETTRQLSVKWDDMNPADYAAEGSFTVQGTVEGTGIKAVAHIKVRTLSFHSEFNMSSLQGSQTLTATVTGTNKGSAAVSSLVTLALYDAAGKLVDKSQVSKSVTHGAPVTLSTNLTLPANVTGYTAKVLVWDGTDLQTSHLQPLSGAAELTSAPGVPVGMTTSPSSTIPQIEIAWQPSPEAASYDLEVDGTTISNITSPFIHQGLLYGSKHTYAVRAKNTSGVSAWSKSISADVTSTPGEANLVVQPFGLSDVTLQDSIFTKLRDSEYLYLDGYNLDKLLYAFRAAAGLDTKGATAMGGWDSAAGKLRGHSTGHFLSAFAQAYASSGEAKWKTKIDYMIDELAKVQDALATQPNSMEKSNLGKSNPALVGNNSPGYLSAYGEWQFILLENGAMYNGTETDFNTIWAPYYTLHKIMAGLLDSYKATGNAKALSILVKMSDWVDGRLSKLPQTTLNSMWGRYIAGEFGGMNETLAEISAITGNSKYLATAKLFDNSKLFTPTANNQDTLNGIHANQHIPQIIGALKVYDQTNDPSYYKVAQNFWGMVTNHRQFSNGGSGVGELFKESDKIASYILEGGTSKNSQAEDCATYNMLKLTRELFFHNPDAKYMDYYERGLYNGILPSKDQSASNNGVVYFMPLGPGSTKGYGRTSFTCCAGTGLESQTKYQDSIYFRSSDKKSLYVNLYMPSTLNWAEKGISVVQTTNFPSEEGSTLTVKGSGQLDIKLRVPYWAVKVFTVKVNGVEQTITATPSTYVTLSKVWANNDKIEISMPYSLRVEKTPDDPAMGSIFYGPLLMVGKSSSTKFINLNLNESDLSQSITPVAGTPLNFTTNGVTLVPMYTAYNFAYHAYFKLNQ
ncbi:beta-L-arabinofuranosidase domain-containing protein [Paenibacillus sp. MAH-36]|uniref:Glycoside hydrolase family 127 protein n=1 Tax=Paenibacillus violae TaxID=3077234 RepID=A0ABU3R9W5_9BACL|nr:beta-L-arabinofuranosidase domain-containing protein [Paenibacillus sp. PFR10]MDU0201060.1 glycoside hydrolase family 127 protein [Paenibacillus sp. PFR10]